MTIDFYNDAIFRFPIEWWNGDLIFVFFFFDYHLDFDKSCVVSAFLFLSRKHFRIFMMFVLTIKKKKEVNFRLSSPVSFATVFFSFIISFRSFVFRGTRVTGSLVVCGIVLNLFFFYCCCCCFWFGLHCFKYQ